jgi:hypothetical protein
MIPSVGEFLKPPTSTQLGFSGSSNYKIRLACTFLEFIGWGLPSASRSFRNAARRAQSRPVCPIRYLEEQLYGMMSTLEREAM